MPPFVQLSDRLWLNLDHVVLLQRRDGGAWEVELSPAWGEEEARLQLTGPEAERLLQHLEAWPERAGGEGDGLVERWRIVEEEP